MSRTIRLSPFVCLSLLPLAACSEPCEDDGLLQDAPSSCDADDESSETETGTPIEPSCVNGVQDSGEADVDCGGACPLGCDDGSSCRDNTDCSSMNCNDASVCEPVAPESPASCQDGLRNGEETDVDCGGPACSPCPNDSNCVEDADCESTRCEQDMCQPTSAQCDDGEANGEEADVDCGGSDCEPCPDGATCSDDTDCESMTCSEANRCEPAPGCGDGEANGSETGVDCGGPDCQPCPDGSTCTAPTDCTSGICVDETCTAPSCDDGLQNGDETDIDCGGSCTPCASGDSCEAPEDCISGGCTQDVCNPALEVAAAPACADSTMGAIELTAVASGGTGGPYTFSWTPDDGSLATPNQATTLATPVGFQSYTVTVDDGLNTATDIAVAVDSTPLNLENNCTLYTADYNAGTGGAATISYDMDGGRACEAGNNELGLHLCEGVSFESTRLSGTLEVLEDDGDNDWVGLVWGAQDAANFYSMVWKQGQQPFFGCSAPSGILVKRIQGPSFADLSAEDIYCPQDTDNSAVLALPEVTTTEGWEPAEPYTVQIEHLPAQSAVTVTRDSDGAVVASFLIEDETFPSGSFGSTTLSQSNACVGPLFGSCI